MLGSITPLGERGRNQRWPVTMAWFAVASLTGGAVAGGLFGAAGEGLLGRSSLAPSARISMLGVLLVIGALVDAGVGGARLPTGRRQVNEDWLRRYRGWVYGGAFGFQLGTGLSTVISSSAVYVTFAAAFLSGGVLPGAVVGGAFGLLRAMPPLATAGIRHPDVLARLGRRLRRWDPLTRRAAVGIEIALALSAMAVVVAAVA
jgi:hypothetical protein